MTRRIDFLHFFYKWLLLWGALGVLPSLLISGKPGISGYLFGFLCISVILGLWDLTLRFTLTARKTSAIWESMLVFLRYGLLGGLFYAIIRWFVVSWPWFFAGVITILPALLTAALLHKEERTSLPED